MVTLSLIRIAFDALLSHRLRSILTLLGIIIGVTSVMTIISALEGMTQAVEEDLSRLGPETFIVARIGIITSDEMFREKIKRKPISYKAVDLIEQGCDLCAEVAPRAFSRASVKYGEHSLRRVLIGGSTSNYIDIVDIEAGIGRFFSSEDDLYRRRVCFIGDQVRETLFEGVDPLGKVIKVGSQKYTVVGVAKKVGSVFGGNPDNFVTIPFSAYIKQFGFPRRGLSVAIKAMSVESLENSMDRRSHPESKIRLPTVQCRRKREYPRTIPKRNSIRRK